MSGPACAAMYEMRRPLDEHIELTVDSGIREIQPFRTRHHAGSSQPSQLQRARPMTSSLSFSGKHANSSVNMVTDWRHEQGMRVISVPQNIRSGPRAS